MTNVRFSTLVGLIFAAALSRLLPHPWNVTPITAMALFSGVYFGRASWAILIPLSAMLLSDLFLGFHGTMWAVYLSFVLTVGLARRLGNPENARTVGGASLTGSVLFFLLTNFAVWVEGSLYPRTLAGLLACLGAAVPFFRNTVLGDLFYTAFLFGTFRWIARSRPALFAR